MSTANINVLARGDDAAAAQAFLDGLNGDLDANITSARKYLGIADPLAGLSYEPETTETTTADDSTVTRFSFHTATEFNKLDLRRDYHIPGILAAGPVPSVASGSFKTLKTSVVTDLVVSMATGSSFLGHFHTTGRIHVAMMSGESGGFALQSLVRRVAHSKGCPVDDIGEHLRICTSVLDLGAKADLAVIEKFITEHAIKLFVIDPTYMALRGLRSDDAGSLFAMGRFLEPLARIGERTGCTPLIVHHNSRGATRTNIEH